MSTAKLKHHKSQDTSGFSTVALASMPGFYLFSRLPLELRQRIWELAMEPREVAVGRCLIRRRRSPTAFPATMLSCTEAWSHPRPFYTKSFPTGTPPQFSWINFDIDTVYCNLQELACCDDELPLMQRLIVECHDSDWFYYECTHRLYLAIALETVTILHLNYGAVEEGWWREYDDILQRWYYRDDSVGFYTKVISVNDPSSFEVNSKNFLKIEREWRRNNPPPPEECPDYQVSDSDDDVDAEWRHRMGYQHVDGCNCPSRRV
ncbi:hypothetical protein OPT61_g4448 [Boeremia exigua]|uniref:Uncharacterized protein n=1 Tax=Boeremia exigua TaxID=749465 RepID=A0ACC2IDY5_9PLEO|nr:hypothetical protein OPT61_g4448 [Boeremia exigua]